MAIDDSAVQETDLESPAVTRVRVELADDPAHRPALSARLDVFNEDEIADFHVRRSLF